MDAHVERLVGAFPELRDARDEHVRYNQELLAHVFYGDDVAPWFLDRLDADERRAKEFSRWLERELNEADESVLNLINVSFLEFLPWRPDPRAERVDEVFGPGLRRALQDMQDYLTELGELHRRQRGWAGRALDAVVGHLIGLVIVLASGLARLVRRIRR